RFGLGCFEDDDYCRRALGAGFRAVIARDSFVHHFGSRTFIGSKIDYAGLMNKNQQLFEEKWAKEIAGTVFGDLAPAEPCFCLEKAPGGGLLIKRREIHLSLC